MSRLSDLVAEARKRCEVEWEGANFKFIRELADEAERAERIVRAIEKEIVIQTPPPGYQFDGDKIVNVLRAILEDSR